MTCGGLHAYEEETWHSNQDLPWGGMGFVGIALMK